MNVLAEAITRESARLFAALTPHERPGMGNLTVFPGGHLRDWRQYPDWKRDKALPDIGRPYEVPLAVGDAVVAL